MLTTSPRAGPQVKCGRISSLFRPGLTSLDSKALVWRLFFAAVRWAFQDKICKWRTLYQSRDGLLLPSGSAAPQSVPEKSGFGAVVMETCHGALGGSKDFCYSCDLICNCWFCKKGVLKLYSVFVLTRYPSVCQLERILLSYWFYHCRPWSMTEGVHDHQYWMEQQSACCQGDLRIWHFPIWRRKDFISCQKHEYQRDTYPNSYEVISCFKLLGSRSSNYRPRSCWKVVECVFGWLRALPKNPFWLPMYPMPFPIQGQVVHCTFVRIKGEILARNGIKLVLLTGLT